MEQPSVQQHSTPSLSGVTPNVGRGNARGVIGSRMIGPIGDGSSTSSHTGTPFSHDTSINDTPHDEKY